MTDRELLKQALFRITDLRREHTDDEQYEIEEALRARLAQPEVTHWSDCDVHSEPAYPAGECDCGGFQPEKEPVVWADRYDLDREGHDFWVSRQASVCMDIPLYTTPPQREWVGLTTAERKVLWMAANNNREFGELIEAKLKEKNNG